MLEQKIADLHRKAHNAAFIWYIRKGRVPEFLTQVIEGTSSFDAFVKFNPYHDPDDGRFTFAPGDESNPDENPTPDAITPELFPWEVTFSLSTIRNIFGMVARRALSSRFFILEMQRFSSHSLTRMEERGIPLSVIKNTIKVGVKKPSRDGTVTFYDSVNNITVVVNKKTNNIVTVRKGKP